MTDKVKCKLCYYKGHPPMLRLHMKWAHDITIEEENK
jgi:hypothetical protein